MDLMRKDRDWNLRHLFGKPFCSTSFFSLQEVGKYVVKKLTSLKSESYGYLDESN